MKFIQIFTFSILILSGSHPSLAAENSSGNPFSIFIFNDSSETMGIEKIKFLLENNPALFTPADSVQDKFDPRVTYWIYLLPEDTVSNNQYVLTFNRHISFAEVYPFPFNHAINYGGMMIPWHLKTLSGCNVMLEHGSHGYLVKVQNRIWSKVSIKDMEVIPVGRFYQTQRKQDIMQGIIQGFFLLMLLYNLILYLVVRQKIHLFYVLYIFCNILYLSYAFHYSEMYFFPGNYQINMVLRSFQIIGLFFYIMFLRQVFLNHCTTYTSVTDRKLFIPLAFIILAVSLFVASTIYYRADLFVMMVGMVNLLSGVMAFSGFMYYHKGADWFVRIIVTGSVIMIISGYISIFTGGYISILKAIFYLSSDDLYYEIGLLLELFLFTYALNKQYFEELHKTEQLNRYLETEAIKRENLAREQFAVKLLESQENERNRIALELHDSIGQKLLLIKNQLLSKIRVLSDENTVKSLKKVSDLTGETIEEIRSISRNLRPQHLDQLGLKTAIETLIEKVEESSQINYKLHIDEIDGLVSHEHEINFYRIIQESLNNIVKHSKATETLINIKRTDHSIYMTIEDNGIGIPQPDNNLLNGSGLIGMQQRAKMIGGILTIHMVEKGGTQIKFLYPLKPGIITLPN
jgi:two-component system, sensor histidine kinase LadS